MNKSKTGLRGMLVLAIIAVVYNVVVFLLPFPKGAVFWLSHCFILAAIAAQIWVMQVAFHKGKDARSRFYGFPIARLGVVYLLAQFALGLIFTALATVLPVPVWLPLALYLVLLGAAAVGLIAADAARDEIERQDTALKKDVSCMRALQSRAASMVGLARDAQVREALEKLSEDLRFSDPVSGGALAEIEAGLTACVDELYQAAADGRREDALALAQKARAVLAERNRMCRLGKH